MNPSDSDASRFKSATTDRRGERDLDDLLVHVARGDQEAFEAVYDRLVGPVYGVTRRVLRDPSHSEEVTQEVLLEVWRGDVGDDHRPPPRHRPCPVHHGGGRSRT